MKSLNNTCQVRKSFSFNGGVVEDCIICGCDAASLVISSAEESDVYWTVHHCNN